MQVQNIVLGINQVQVFKKLPERKYITQLIGKDKAFSDSGSIIPKLLKS